MDDEEGGDEYGRSEEEDPWNEDKRKAYAKRVIKESKDLPAHFRKPDYKANMSSSEAESAPVSENSEKAGEKEEAPRPREKKKEEYEL